jgi:dienelactone hydrolase
VAEIVLFHSALGLRPGVADAASRLRAAGHVIHTPDLFRGRAWFDDPEPAVRYCRSELGLTELLGRAREAVAPLPAELVYAGFSLGASFAASLAAGRPGARAAFLLSGCPAPEAVGAARWPADVPVQIHRMTDDPWMDSSSVRRLVAFVRAGGGRCVVNDYAGSGHLFADPDLPDFEPAAANLLWQRTLAFLAWLDGGSPS